VLSIAAPLKAPSVPVEVMVSVPQRVGRTLGYTLFDYLADSEKEAIYKAARAIYETYALALKIAGLEAE